ncbi:transposase family protein, partial [Streptomyces hayashii]|uniref:transposase family protein n=1 Tax=Streptomyces hayashii TaxID=2839966 RepID=UPI00403C293B
GRPPDARTGTSFISGKSKQNAVETMVLTDADGRMLFCSPPRPGSCADITHARQLGLVSLLANGPVMEILADANYQGLGAQTGGRGNYTAPSHVQEERSGLVRGNVRATAQSAHLTTYPG